MTRYAWIVDEDPATEPTDDLYRVGTCGPSSAPGDLLARLRSGGEGIRWETRYEEGEDPEHDDVVHAGRILFADGSDVNHADDHAAFGPLNDLSAPDCGAVDIFYLINDQWVGL